MQALTRLLILGFVRNRLEMLLVVADITAALAAISDSDWPSSSRLRRKDAPLAIFRVRSRLFAFASVCIFTLDTFPALGVD